MSYTNLSDLLNDIANSIRNKTNLTRRIFPSEFPALIKSIGDQEIISVMRLERNNVYEPIFAPQVNFYSNTGENIYSYSLEEFKQLTEMPALPESNYDIVWTHTLEEIKEREESVNVSVILNSIASTEIDIKLKTARSFKVAITKLTEGSIIINWGDGFSTEVNDDNAMQIFEHNYENDGEYTVAIQAADNVKYRLGGIDSNPAAEEVEFKFYNLVGEPITNKTLSLEEWTVDSEHNYAPYTFSSEALSVKSVRLSNAVQIGNAMFHNLLSLKEVMFSKQHIVDEDTSALFFNCINIKHIVLPEGMTNIGKCFITNKLCNFERDYCWETTGFGYYEMQGSTTLRPIVWSSHDDSNYIYCFRMLPKLKSVVVSSTITETKERAFNYCEKLRDFDFRNIKIIGEKSFLFCLELNIVSAINVEQIMKDAFKACNLIEVNMPKITCIEEGAFQSNRSLLHVNFPNAEVIKGYSFCENRSLTYIDLPKATKLGSYTFALCTNIEYADFPNVDEILTVQSTNDWDSNKVFGQYLGNTFNQCFSLKEINLPKVEHIGSSTCTYCYALEKIDFSSVKTMHSNVFQNCKTITKISLPNLEYMLWECFYYCQNLEELDLPKLKFGTPYDIDEECAWFQGCSYELNNIHYIRQRSCAYCDNLTKVNLESFDGVLSDNFFNYCRKLKEVNIPKVTGLLMYCFTGCENLEEIEGPEIEYIDYSTFSSCYALRKINFPKLKSFALPEDSSTSYGYKTYTFSSCYSLEEFIAPEFDGIVLDRDFNNCKNIKTYQAPLKEIGTNAFTNCKKLEELDLSSITTLGNSGLANTGIKRAVIPAAVNTIGNYAFASCSSLEYIKIEAPSISIGNAAFADCFSLKELNLESCNINDCVSLLHIPMSSSDTIKNFVLYNHPCYLQSYDELNKIYNKEPKDIFKIVVHPINYTSLVEAFNSSYDPKVKNLASYVTYDEALLVKTVQNGDLQLSSKIEANLLDLDEKPVSTIKLKTLLLEEPVINIVSTNNEAVIIQSFNFVKNNDLDQYIEFSAVGVSEQSTDVVISITDGDFEYNASHECTPFMQNYLVLPVEGASYGFAYDASLNRWVSQNKGKSSSAALCKVLVQKPTAKYLKIYGQQYSEKNYDYAILSKLNTALDTSNYSDSSSYYQQSYRGTSSSSSEYYTLYNSRQIQPGDWIYIKYRKDSSGDSGWDQFRFRVTFAN